MTRKYNLKTTDIDGWNNSIDDPASIASLKLLLFQVISSNGDQSLIVDPDRFTNTFGRHLSKDHKIKLLTGLSVLEICLLIAIRHHCEIYDNDPFNFEIIHARFNKFALKSSTVGVDGKV